MVKLLDIYLYEMKQDKYEFYLFITLKMHFTNCTFHP